MYQVQKTRRGLSSRCQRLVFELELDT